MQTLLKVLGAFTATIYFAIALLSLRFQEEGDPGERPMLPVLALLMIACVAYLASLAVVARTVPASGRVSAGRSSKSRVVFREVLWFSILFRLVMLISVPIQEVDFYRYLWDGRVLLEGLNPYHFAPAEIDLARADSPGELSNYAAVRDASASVSGIFYRVHHRQVPTIYPPLAQVFFALCAAITPAAAPICLHVSVLRGLLLLVDVAILYSMRGLLRQVGMSEVWCLAYGWCPLAIKEVANSVHFDGLAVLCMLGALLLLGKAPQARSAQWSSQFRWAIAGGCFGMAILSKIFPIVLLPIAMSVAVARTRLRAIVPLFVCAAVVAAGYLPFLDRPTDFGTSEGVSAGSDEPWTGLRTFLTKWQMNDLLFMLVHENLRRPQIETGRWFVVTPREWRGGIDRHAASWISQWGIGHEVDPAFIAAQLFMGLLLMGIVLVSARRVFRSPEPRVLLRSAFIVLAWSWLLNSAQNPWYVVWFLPLMPFARCRSWFLIPCLALVYYLRFWLVYQGEWVAATGECPVFDYVGVWFEHGIVLGALSVEFGVRRFASRRTTHSGVSVGTSSDLPAPTMVLSDA